jgi:hypothetical protein
LTLEVIKADLQRDAAQIESALIDSLLEQLKVTDRKEAPSLMLS